MEQVAVRCERDSPHRSEEVIGEWHAYRVPAPEDLVRQKKLFIGELKESVDTPCQRLPKSARAKSVRRLPPEFHLTLFPQGNRERRSVRTTKEKKIP